MPTYRNQNTGDVVETTHPSARFERLANWERTDPPADAPALDAARHAPEPTTEPEPNPELLTPDQVKAMVASLPAESLEELRADHEIAADLEGDELIAAIADAVVAAKAADAAVIGEPAPAPDPEPAKKGGWFGRGGD